MEGGAGRGKIRMKLREVREEVITKTKVRGGEWKKDLCEGSDVSGQGEAVLGGRRVIGREGTDLA